MPATVRLNLPNSLWTAKDSARLAANTVAAIKLRTSKGLDADGNLSRHTRHAPSMWPLEALASSLKVGACHAQGEASFTQVVISNTSRTAEGVARARLRSLTWWPLASCSTTLWCSTLMTSALSSA